MRRPLRNAIRAHACGEQTQGEEARRQGNDQVFHENSLSKRKAVDKTTPVVRRRTTLLALHVSSALPTHSPAESRASGAPGEPGREAARSMELGARRSRYSSIRPRMQFRYSRSK